MTRAPALPLENLASPGPVEERAVNPAAAEVAAHQAATTTTTTHPHLYGVDPQPDGLTMAGAVPPLPLMRTTTMTRAPPLHLANPASLAEVEESLERVAEAAAESRVRAATPAARPPTMMMITHPGTPTTKDTGSTSHRILPAVARLPRPVASQASPVEARAESPMEVEAARVARADTLEAAAARPLLLALTAGTEDMAATSDTEATADGALPPEDTVDGMVDIPRPAAVLRLRPAGNRASLPEERAERVATLTAAAAALLLAMTTVATTATEVTADTSSMKPADGAADPDGHRPDGNLPDIMVDGPTPLLLLLLALPLLAAVPRQAAAAESLASPAVAVDVESLVRAVEDSAAASAAVGDL